MNTIWSYTCLLVLFTLSHATHLHAQQTRATFEDELQKEVTLIETTAILNELRRKLSEQECSPSLITDLEKVLQLEDEQQALLPLELRNVDQVARATRSPTGSPSAPSRDARCSPCRPFLHSRKNHSITPEWPSSTVSACTLAWQPKGINAKK